MKRVPQARRPRADVRAAAMALLVLAAAVGCDAEETRDRSGTVDIGSGRTVYLECSGSGSPTVVLVSGAGVAADNWSYTGVPNDEQDPPARAADAVYPRMAKISRVCAYDRPGVGLMDDSPSRSSPVGQPTTAQDGVSDLHALLASAEVPGPYVLVGHSWGGLIAATYARTYPRDVTGLVLVDPGSQYLEPALGQESWRRWMRDIAVNVERNPGAETPDYPGTLEGLTTAGPLPATPTVVLSSDKPFDFLGRGDPDAFWPQWLEAGRQLSSALDATHITKTGSGHFIENENAALVVEQICSVMSPPRKC